MIVGIEIAVNKQLIYLGHSWVHYLIQGCCRQGIKGF